MFLNSLAVHRFVTVLITILSMEIVLNHVLMEHSFFQI